MMKRTLLVLCCMTFSVGWAREEILEYQVEINVQEDASLLIREAITVRAEGDQIKRGIFRDFPVKYDGKTLFGRRVGFQVLSVQRNGEPEDWRVESRGRYERVYVGNKNTLIPQGTHTYVLEYRTTRQIGFFEDQDELYYNAIAHKWSFPIKSAEVQVTFPNQFSDVEFVLDVWTGGEGEKQKHAEILQSGPLTVSADLTRSLEEQEGMTLLIQWPKGILTQPSAWTEWKQLFEDEIAQNPYARIAGIGAMMSLGTYLILWFLYGRDPAKGVVIPRYEAPEGVSPAGARYLMGMGFDPACFVASILNLAAKGWVEIRHPDGKDYTLLKKEASGKELTPEEDSVFKLLLGSRSTFEIKQKNYSKLQKARDAVKKHCKKQYEGSHFLGNGKMVVPGMLFSLLTLGLFAWTAKSEEVAFLLLWISFWTLGVVMLMRMVGMAWKNLYSDFGVGKLIQALFITAFATPFFAGEIVVGSIIAQKTSVLGVLLLLSQIPILLIFRKLLKQPTREGRKVMDELDGLKMYLSTAEVDRLHAMHVPELTPEHFDAMLPYALALNVEQKWAEALDKKLSSLNDPRAGTYHPHYYSGRSFTTSAAMCGALGRGLVSNVSSSSAAPGSSSGGGGGGSSGGGGGGGGGGGW